jgi:hypothetical protein
LSIEKATVSTSASRTPKVRYDDGRRKVTLSR